LVGAEPDRPWDGRGHFFAAAAESMRRILVENARRRHEVKRGGHRARVDLDKAEPTAPETDELLTGSTPLERERLREVAFTEVLRRIREEEPPRPSARLQTTEQTS
jgi:hypothetical protein